MPENFDKVRAKLEAQYQNIQYDPESGWPEEELATELERHRVENPDEPRIMTRAWLFKLLCEKGRIAVDPEDYFVDKLEHHNLLVKLREEWRKEEAEREFKNDPPSVKGAWTARLDCDSHICPEWRNIIKYGIAAMRDRASNRSGSFYEAVSMVYDAIATLFKRFNAAQPNMNLAELAERPPKTFQEALQIALVFNELIGMEGEQVRSMGRFDILYNSFYENDLKTGLITRDHAKELLKYFWIKYFAQTQGKLFGKPFLFGPDVNALSYLSFEAFQEMRTVDPKFHVRLAERTPKKFLEKVTACIQSGCSSIVIVNDDAQVEMLQENGKTLEDAKDYILIGCYEPAVMGKELNCSGASNLNLAKAVELALEREDYSSFDELMDSYIGILDDQFAFLADKVRRWESLWPRINPSPLLSGAMDSCLEKGLDCSEAGAKYNTSGCCCVGLANAVDSLAVIRQLVFEEKYCTLSDIKSALAANWQGFEKLRLTAKKRIPKWGNNDEQVDAMAIGITDFLGKRINNEPNARGGVFQAALYGIIGAAKVFGKDTGALPDGRVAGEQLTMNTGASPGMDKNGITSLINSVTKIDLALFPNGTVLDIMLHPSAVIGQEGVETIASIVRTHFARGGMSIQFNIFDVAILREAQKDPEKYASLQVRVCGWSVRFADLAPEEQDIFIAKAEEVA